MKVLNPKLCLRCKGRLFCGLKYCPILVKKRFILKSKFLGKKEIEGYSFGGFVGWRGYPVVSFGFFVSEKNKIKIDGEYLEVVEERLKMVLSKRKVDVKEPLGLENPFIEVSASKPIYLFVEFKKPIKLKTNFFPDYYPIGPREFVERFEALDEPKVPRIVEKLYYDEIKARDAVLKLYKKNFNVMRISELLSLGLFGKEKRMVPTRWSVTAVDKIISDFLKEKIKGYPFIEENYYGKSEIFGNVFEVFILEGPLILEYYETYYPEAGWNPSKLKVVIKDKEILEPPKDPNTSGAFYAVRLAVFEFLEKIKRKAYVVVIRKVKKEYVYPLGVWVVREGVRRALKNLKVLKSKIEVKKYGKIYCLCKGFDTKGWKNSRFKD